MYLWVNWKKYILRKWLSQNTLSKVHLNKCGSYFKFILFLSGDINLNPGSTTPERNDMLWELLPFNSCSFSAERIDYQPDSFSGNRNNACNIHFIHLSVNRLLPKIDEIRYITKLTYVTVIELSETKLDKANLSSELEIEGHDLVRSDRSRRGGKVACFVKNFVSYNEKPNFCI